MSGEWSGTTAHGLPITFTVSPDEKVTAISLEYSFNACSGSLTFAGMRLETGSTVTCIPGPCAVLLPAYRSFSYNGGSAGGPFTIVNGLFTAANRAEGAVALRDYPGCGTALGVGWTATKR